MRILWCPRCRQANNTAHSRCLNCRRGYHSWVGNETEQQSCRVCGLQRIAMRGRLRSKQGQRILERGQKDKRWYRFYFWPGQDWLSEGTKEAPRCGVPAKQTAVDTDGESF